MSISRRKLLRLGAIAPFLLPVVRSQSLLAAGKEDPKLVLFFTPNGPVDQRGPATGDENGFEIESFWKPLDTPEIRANGIFIRSLKHAGARIDGVSVHSNNGRRAFTHSKEGGASIDQKIASALEDKFGLIDTNIVLGLHDASPAGPFYKAAGVPAEVINNPFVAYRRLFGDMVGGDADLNQRSIIEGRSVLDHVYEDCVRQKNTFLGAEGKALLEEYCENVRDFENNLRNLAQPEVAQCRDISGLETDLPDHGRAVNWYPNYDKIMDAFNQIISLAFMCGQKRVVGVSIAKAAARFAIPSEYGVPASGVVNSNDSGSQHHAWTHNYDNKAERIRALEIFYNWYSDKVVQLRASLQNTQGATGRPLSDSTVIYWSSELGGCPEPTEDAAHQSLEQPGFLLGSGDGYFRTGRAIDGKNSGVSENGIYLALADYMNADIRSFGDGHESASEPWSALF